MVEVNPLARLRVQPRRNSVAAGEHFVKIISARPRRASLSISTNSLPTKRSAGSLPIAGEPKKKRSVAVKLRCAPKDPADAKWFENGLGGITLVPGIPLNNRADEPPEAGTSVIENVLDHRQSIEYDCLEYRVKWFKYSLNCTDPDTGLEKEWWLHKGMFESSDGEPWTIRFYEQREKIAKRFAATLKKAMGPEEFQNKYPGFEKRNNYKGLGEDVKIEDAHRLYLRGIETNWNGALAGTGQAMLYIFDWTEGTMRKFKKFKYSTDLMLNSETYSSIEQSMGKICDKSSVSGITYCKCNGVCGPKCACNARDQYAVFTRCDGKLMSNTVKPGHSLICCNERCSCGPECPRKITQSGRQKELILFFISKEKGWGIFAAEDIQKGSYLGNYTGDLYYAKMPHSGTYNKKKSTIYELTLPSDNRLGEFMIDALGCGNEFRFFNNSCSPNLVAINMYTSHEGLLNTAGFFATENLKFGSELTIRYTTDKMRSGKRCLCSEGCTTRI